MKYTRKDFEEYLNELGTPAHDHPEHGGRVSPKMVDRYGSWLRSNDPTAFQVGYNEWVVDQQYRNQQLLQKVRDRLAEARMLSAKLDIKAEGVTKSTRNQIQDRIGDAIDIINEALPGS
jgi:hypothetical protein